MRRTQWCHTHPARHIPVAHGPSLETQLPFGHSGSELLRGRLHLRSLSTKISAATSLTTNKYSLRKEELKDLVDIYSVSRPEGSEGTKTQDNDDQQSERLWEDERQFEPADEQNAAIVNGLKDLLTDRDADHIEVYNTYRSLSSPGSSQLPRRTLDQLLDHLMSVEHKTEAAMLRYLSIVEDTKSVGRPLRIRHWNSAIAFTGQCFWKVSDTQVESAMNIWREMEQRADVKSNAVTLNILFDIATKARKFLLAEMIHEEMQKRDIELDRYFYTSLIYHHGLRRDGNKVRKAYSELVDAGEIVDTAVINCVIASLLLCGEATAAEYTFEKQKQLHGFKVSAPLPPTHWRDRRRTGRDLSERARRRRRERAEETLDGPFTPNQDSHTEAALNTDDGVNAVVLDSSEQTLDLQTSVAPDLQTYAVLIGYHAVNNGDIDRVASLVEEMEEFNITLHGTIFMHLFKGFYAHGGTLYSQWTIRRLENTWLSYLAAVDDGSGRVFVSPSAAITIAKAFMKCEGPGRAADAWLELRPRLRGDFRDSVDAIERRVGARMGEGESIFWEVIEQRHLEMDSARQKPEANPV